MVFREKKLKARHVVTTRLDFLNVRQSEVYTIPICCIEPIYDY